MSVTIQDDMAEVMEMLPESQQGDFARAIVLFGCRGLEPTKSAPWYPLFHAFRSRLELSSHMRQLGKKGNATRWKKTPDVSASIAEEDSKAIPASIAEEQQSVTSASVLSRVEKSREEESIGEKRLGEERIEKEKKENENKNELDTISEEKNEKEKIKKFEKNLDLNAEGVSFYVDVDGDDDWTPAD